MIISQIRQDRRAKLIKKVYDAEIEPTIANNSFFTKPAIFVFHHQ